MQTDEANLMAQVEAMGSQLRFSHQREWAWLVAVDAEVPPTDGYTLETRLDHFIDELAHIGRAHNWDNTRVKTDNEGTIILDADDNPITEEYDNLEGDKPSCFFGVKRRLFQSVQGHPLLKMLTKDGIDEELRDLILA